ncbi:MAG: cob(I)yrinic acid a,c-diamide adenosyltransferase [Bdellovibrionales bacterium]|nr:cob(I)yrinic acid a,c-diamide adenosyltransferase [Bdellovibrionales bacterium]
MKKAAVYTRTGDKGLTGLVGGTRTKKSDPRINLYGEVDELNSYIGVAITLLESDFDKSLLLLIQSSLFDLGSNLACEKNMRNQFKLPQITETLIERLEQDIDQMDAVLLPLKHFILPGGDKAAAFFHVCRTVCRRIEREMVDFEDENPGEIPDLALKYMNRLSDYFFILSRYINSTKKIEETLWIPEA